MDDACPTCQGEGEGCSDPFHTPDPLTTGRPRFYWENGPFSHSDLPQIARDINERMSEEEIRLAVLSINKTSTRSQAERKKGTPAAKAKKAKEKDLLKAYMDMLATQGVDKDDVVKAHLRSSANSTPQQELEKITSAKRVSMWCPVCDLPIPTTSNGVCEGCGYNGE